MVDIVPPTEAYSAARYAADAERVIRDITARGRLPILVGGTGLYYRALTRGMFPDRPVMKRCARGSRRWATGAACCSCMTWCAASIPSPACASSRGTKRLIRALEVALLTGIPLSTHFAATRAPLADYDTISFALRIPPEAVAERVAVRVDQQFARGVVDEVKAILASGVPG